MLLLSILGSDIVLSVLQFELNEMHVLPIRLPKALSSHPMHEVSTPLPSCSQPPLPKGM